MAIKPRVLIVDDEKEVRQQFALFLTQRLDCEIIEEADGQKAIDRIGQEEFHIVLLDQHMPGIDGFTILEHIHQKSPQTTVIVITGLGGSAASHKVERLGGIYMAKPVSLKALQLTIERELEKRGGFSFQLP